MAIGNPNMRSHSAACIIAQDVMKEIDGKK
jgi:hypothetical protein